MLRLMHSENGTSRVTENTELQLRDAFNWARGQSQGLAHLVAGFEPTIYIARHISHYAIIGVSRRPELRNRYQAKGENLLVFFSPAGQRLNVWIETGGLKVKFQFRLPRDLWPDVIHGWSHKKRRRAAHV